SSLSTPLELLLQVGGVKKTGSLRNVIILRGNKKITVDLYNIINGSQADITLLRDGDRLIVPTIGETIAISGYVIRPGIYELPSGEESILS
ncbi:MAG: SLBB domain-containing protein, partial [Gammaproteobacteria bacterium]